MKEIILTNSKKRVMVDDDDFEYLSQYKWVMDSYGYAQRLVRREGRNTTIKMAREIMKFPKGKFVDHIDTNPLNNQKENLRECTKRENMRNRGKNKNNKSGYKGVSWYKNSQKFRAVIVHDGKQYHLGMFTNAKEAAKAYDQKAIELHKEFAHPNFPKK